MTVNMLSNLISCIFAYTNKFSFNFMISKCVNGLLAVCDDCAV